MYKFRDLYNNSKSAFSDIFALTNFADNHDNPRFLSFNGNINSYKNAIAFSMTWPGIPILYYGDEQGFNGGADPNNRETLWGHMDTSSSLYQFVKEVVSYRQRN
jgi:alpha-amylase